MHNFNLAKHVCMYSYPLFYYIKFAQHYSYVEEHYNKAHGKLHPII